VPTPALGEERRVADAIVAVLAEAGVDAVLGMPGGYTGPLFSALHGHPTIRTVQVREESIGPAMAEAYGRLTGRPLVVMGQGEWIAGNAGQGFLEALLGSSPVLILTEMSDGGALSHHAPYQSGTADYGTWDARGALAAVTKRVMVSHDPGQAVQHVQLALKHALTGEPGPVAVVFHSQALRGRVGGGTPRLYPTAHYLPRAQRAIDVAALADAASALAGATRPVVVAGNGVRVGQATAELAAFARAYDAPVVTTASGKGVFVETDPLAGGVIGPFGWPSANALLGEADVVLAVGTKLGPHDTADEHADLLDPERQTIVQVDVEPLNAGWTYPVDHVVVGDARVVLPALVDAVVAHPGAARPVGAAARVAAALERDGEWGGPAFVDDRVPFAPQRVIAVLQEVYGPDGCVTCDAGENRLFMMHWYRSQAPGAYLQPAAGGGMGYAVPAAMAAKLAHPDRPALAVCGDGGFAMSIHSLMTAVQEDLPVGVLVLNNGALGWVLHGMGERAVAASFSSFDHAAIARSLGCDGVAVTNTAELRDALKLVADLRRPLVIDVPTSLATSFRDITQDIGRRRRESGY
jgi:acetolactate synthase-1/2/3 large subunit